MHAKSDPGLVEKASGLDPESLHATFLLNPHSSVRIHTALRLIFHLPENRQDLRSYAGMLHCSVKMREKNFGFELKEREHVSVDDLREKFLKESSEPFPNKSFATSMKFCETLDE